MSAQASPYKVHSREITQKANKGEQPFLHATHRLDPIYMPTKYYQNISKGIKVIERTSFCLRTDRRTDRRTDGQTDGRQADRYIPRSFSGRGIKIAIFDFYLLYSFTSVRQFLLNFKLLVTYENKLI